MSKSLPDAGDSIAGHLFALTLTDDGVGTEHAPSKLWSSRAEFQDTGPSRSVIANPPSGGSVPIADLTNSLNRLMLRSASPSTLPSNELSNTSSSSGSVTPTLVVGGCRLPKRDSHRRTVKALQLLNNVESRIHRCSRLLLKPSDVDYSFLQREVTTLRQATDNVTWIADSVKSKKRMLLTLLQELEAEVSSHLPVLQGPVDINTETQYQPPVERMDVVAQVTLLIGVVCSIIFGIGTTGANFIMSSLSLVLYLAFQKADGALSAAHENVMKQIPSTISGALSKFQLNTKTIQYAVCACHCIYPPVSSPGSSGLAYPERCNNFPTPEIQCTEELLDTGTDGTHRPKKTFVYHDFKDYLAMLMSRGDIERAMDEACDDLQASLSSPPRIVKNPFEAQFLREFRGPNPMRLFVDRGDEGRYAFALHVDFFNPEGMSIRGPSTSSGIISMACLNLPPDVQYKPENIYLAGIIPGPKQPSLEHLNHYIWPLVDDMVTAWNQGIRFSRTANYPNGRVTRSAVALVICDLPAARHLAAFAGVRSHFFCSACNCYHKTNYARTDFHNWTTRDRDKTRHFAEQWRDAPTSAERDKIFKEHGVRYSELWRLPYWDPARQLVVDSMHCILEGLVQYHVRSLLRLTNETLDAARSSKPAFHFPFKQVDPNTATELSMGRKEISQVSAVHELLTAQVPHYTDDVAVKAYLDRLRESILRKNTRALKFICQSLGCIPSKQGRTFKADYAKALIDWRAAMPFSPTEVATEVEYTQFDTREVLCRVRSVIRDTVTPSWLGSVPTNFGDLAAGTMKADEWRILAMVYLPIALISLWGATQASPRNDGPDLKAVLDHTMDLVSAVYLACARTTSNNRATAYRAYIASYVGKLKTIYPASSARPNHHVSFHIYDYLILFGPVHSWWSFPFERLIGMLQHLPKNHKSGLEATMMQSYLKAAKLRGWLSRPRCPPAIRECKILLDRTYGVTGASQDLSDDTDDDGVLVPPTAVPVVVPRDLFRLTHQRTAVLRAHVRHEGVVYSRSSTHVGNSLIMFYPQGYLSASPIPGSIKYIFGDNGLLTLAVQRQLPLPSRKQHDPFASYPHFPAKLYSSVVSDDLETVRLSWVVSHFSRLAVTDDRVVVLSLCRD